MTDTTKPPTGGKGLRWALVASLAVNLGVAGLALGVWLHDGPGGHGPMVRDLGFGPYDDALRPQDRDALRAALRGKLGDLAASRQQMAADVTAVLAALRADPFDANALDAALAAQQAHLSARMKIGNDTMRDFLAALPQADRLAFADRLEAKLKRGRRGVAGGN